MGSVSSSNSGHSLVHTAYLGLGSNLGDRETNISRAIALIAEQAGAVVRQSALFYSEPWGFESSNTFVNAVVCIHTRLTPKQLLRATQRIERALGKNGSHATQRKPGMADVYHDRPVDIDILLYDDLTISDPVLTIPHPLMWQRPFVTVPLSEVLPPDSPYLDRLQSSSSGDSPVNKK